MAEPTASQGYVLPFYLVCDVSASMGVAGRIAALAQALADLRDAFWLNPVVSDATRLCLITFAGTAELTLPLCDLADAQDLPTLAPRGLTNFAPALRLLRRSIVADAEQLAADGLLVRRPVVFFFSDGAPTDAGREWRAARAELLDPAFALHPDVVCFGVGEANPEVLVEMATVRCFAASTGTDVAAAIAAIGDLVVRSVVASGTTGEVWLPDAVPDGFDELDLP